MTMDTPAAPAPGPVLRLRDVRVTYAGIHAVDGVSLDVAPRETVGVVGANGAGKTTLINVITGAAACSSGQIALGAGRRIDGVGSARLARLGLARTFQSMGTIKSLTAAEYVMMGVALRPRRERAWRRLTPRRGTRAAALDVLAWAKLGQYADRRLAELSYGTRKMIDICRAIAGEPELVLLDEPTSGTVTSERAEIAALIRDISTRSSVILVDHDLEFVRDLSDRVAVMSLGAISHVLRPEDSRWADVSF